MRALMMWWLIAALALPLTSFSAVTARAQTQEPLPHTEEARIQRLREVSAAHQLTPAEARHQADTQLFLGAFIVIASLLAPLIAEIRDEEFPAIGSILIGSIGLAVLIEGGLDEREAGRISTQAAIMEQIQALEEGDGDPETDPPVEDDG